MGPGWVLEQVISGGQAGVDQVALRIAQALGYRTGGCVPRGCRTDAGPAPWLVTQFGCDEHKVSDQYLPRTRENVRRADATVIFDAEVETGYDYFNGRGSAGCYATWKYCLELKKPYHVNPTIAELQQFILRGAFKVLNVAGNRHRTHPESAERAAVVLRAGLLPF